MDAPEHRLVRAAQDAYLAGARKLEHDDLSGAERDFDTAHQLDPGSADFSVALTLAREHHLTELVQQSGKARLAGDVARADRLLAEARAIDPDNQILREHSGLAQAAGPTSSLTDRAHLLSASDMTPAAPAFAGPLQLKPNISLQSFHMREESEQVLRDVAGAYGIRVVFDEPLGARSVRFDLGDEHYDGATRILMKMLHVFAVPIDETSILVAKDNDANRQRLLRQLQETVYLPGMTTEQMTEIANVVRNIFEVKQATVDPTLGAIVLRAPAENLPALNRTLQDLIDGGGEVMLDVKLYEIEKTRTRDIGATIPQQFTTFNVSAAAFNLVNQNQALVQQGIAQGLILSTDSTLTIALKLLASGLVQSSLLQNLLGVFGGGLTQFGINGSASTSFTLSLNSSDTRALDDVQLQVMDRQAANFRAGTKYPVTTSTYSTGLSTAAAGLSGASINGVSVASLLAQYAGGSSTTIPQVSYEDLGVTLNTTPTMQKSNRVNLKLELKIEALAGGMANGIPVLASRQFVSDITVGEGDTVMMLSTVSRSESAAVSGLPGLSELPGFQAPIDKNAEQDTGQLVVLVTPHILRRRSDTIAGPRIVVHALDNATTAN